MHEVKGPPGAPVLLLMHGLAATALLNWATSFTTLGRGFRVIALDHRGHGRGIRRIGAFKLEDCADDAAALADHLGVERVIPVGYSMGGAVAQLFWRRHPARTAGLVLCATGSRFGGPRAERAASTLGPLLSLAARVAPQTLWDSVGERMLANVQDPDLQQTVKEQIGPTDPLPPRSAGSTRAHGSSRSTCPPRWS
ncbi:MAG: alpha/beta fold hydrolase [Acidobacteria bacterium]|nr:alpha/beta fold hydrolase [Acidobacteriota bacterium]